MLSITDSRVITLSSRYVLSSIFNVCAYTVIGETDKNYFKKVLADVIVPEFTPRSGVKIQVRENETTDQAGSAGMFLDSMYNA